MAIHSYTQVYTAILTQLYISVYSYVWLHHYIWLYKVIYGYTQLYMAIHGGCYRGQQITGKNDKEIHRTFLLHQTSVVFVVVIG